MNRFEQMRIYVAVAEAAGFAAGARRLGISAPMASRGIASLEQSLGVKLLERSTRTVKMTEAGRCYLEDARRILTDVDQADAAAAGVHQTPKGRLTVTAPVLFGRKYILPCITTWLKRFDETEVNALFVDRNVNLVEEGIDIGIRIGELSDSSLQARRLGEVRKVLVASPQYLETYGRPDSPAKLTQHCLIGAQASGNTNWSFQDSKKSSLRLPTKLTVNTNDAAIASACAGFGITQVLSYQVATALEKGELEILLPDREPPPQPVHVLHHEGRHTRGKVRSFIELLVTELHGQFGLSGSRPIP